MSGANIQNIFSKANEFEQRFQYSEALKYYYFACPAQFCSFANSRIERSKSRNGNSFTHKRIDWCSEFFHQRRQKISDKEREITVAVAVHDSLLQSVEFSFWDGANQVTMRNGWRSIISFDWF